MLSFDPFLLRLRTERSLCYPHSFPINLTTVGECWAVMCGRMHVDRGTLTSTRWACGLAAASLLLFCLYNGITSTKQKKKKGRSHQFLGPSSFILPFRQVLGVWFAGCRARVHTQVARKRSAVEFPAGLPGMKRWERIWGDLLGFTLQTSVLGNTLLIPCAWCDNSTDKPCDI